LSGRQSGSGRILNVEHVLRIDPNDAVIQLEPLKRVAAKALGYLIGVRVKSEAKRFPIFATEHDHARDEEESTQQSPPEKGAESQGCVRVAYPKSTASGAKAVVGPFLWP
jgi:hypothetical protein